jgi:hypothetical protein
VSPGCFAQYARIIAFADRIFSNTDQRRKTGLDRKHDDAGLRERPLHLLRELLEVARDPLEEVPPAMSLSPAYSTTMRGQDDDAIGVAHRIGQLDPPKPRLMVFRFGKYCGRFQRTMVEEPTKTISCCGGGSCVLVLELRCPIPSPIPARAGTPVPTARRGAAWRGCGAVRGP